MFTSPPKPAGMAAQLQRFLVEPFFEYPSDPKHSWATGYVDKPDNCFRLRLTSPSSPEGTKARCGPPLHTSKIAETRTEGVGGKPEATLAKISCGPCSVAELLAPAALSFPWVDISGDEGYGAGFRDHLAVEYSKVGRPMDLSNNVHGIHLN